MPEFARILAVPEPVSAINVPHRRCREVMRRCRAWDTCSAMPASPPPTSNPSSKSTPWSRPAATGCSPRRPAAPAPTALPWSGSWTSCGPATPLVVWKLNRLGRSLRHLVDARHWAGGARDRVPQSPRGDRHHHPRRQARLPRLRRPGRVRTRPHPGTHGRGTGCRPGSWPPGRPAVGHDCPQGPGGWGDVRVRGVHAARANADCGIA
jgi:hypothetical protein